LILNIKVCILSSINYVESQNCFVNLSNRCVKLNSTYNHEAGILRNEKFLISTCRPDQRLLTFPLEKSNPAQNSTKIRFSNYFDSLLQIFLFNVQHLIYIGIYILCFMLLDLNDVPLTCSFNMCFSLFCLISGKSSLFNKRFHNQNSLCKLNI
jgi:hypothetical protein